MHDTNNKTEHSGKVFSDGIVRVVKREKVDSPYNPSGHNRWNSRRKTKWECIKSFQKTMRNYYDCVYNHAYTRLNNGFVYFVTLTLKAPLNDITEMRNICRDFQLSLSRSKLFNECNFQYAQFIEMGIKQYNRGVCQPHVHYILIGDRPPLQSFDSVKQAILGKWNNVDPRTSIQENRISIVNDSKDLHYIVTYLTDYASNRPTARKKKVTLKAIPIHFDPASKSRGIEKPIRFKSSTNPCEDLSPNYCYQAEKDSSYYRSYKEYKLSEKELNALLSKISGEKAKRNKKPKLRCDTCSPDEVGEIKTILDNSKRCHLHLNDYVTFGFKKLLNKHKKHQIRIRSPCLLTFTIPIPIHLILNFAFIQKGLTLLNC
ncbi:MAG: hypothetical protein IJI47_02500 [Eubacterium sp.]|nr:hypothetical protein [Eubacterium sp.]MBR0412423.1 hypothetical protein [Eubacterium sp.]